MSKQVITVPAATASLLPLSPAVRFGQFVFVSGQGPFDPVTRECVGASITEQTARVLDNIKQILAAAGATLDDVVKVTVHLADLADFADFNEVYRHYFPADFPARTTVQSGLPRILVEIDAIACTGEPQ